MKSITAIWFEVKARYEQTQEDGTQKKVIETFVVRANDFAEAYNKACEYACNNLTSGEYDILNEKIASYAEIFLSDSINDDKYYRVKVVLITLNERTGKERKTPIMHLVQASSVDKARKYTDEFYSQTMTDFTINEVVETKITDVVHDVQ
jgi:hypothetical protein